LYHYNLLTWADEATTAAILKYRHENNFLRWALKPHFLLHLLENEECVIYLDNDIYFYQPFQFLFDQLRHCSLLLTPHWGCYSPWRYEESFKTNYQIGLFNAGFVGATKRARELLEWWADVCLFNMSGDYRTGFFVDQRYLDMTVIMDEFVGIVRHPGCNVGSWNMHQNKRTGKHGRVMINGDHPVVFIHFNKETIEHISNGNDSVLRPFYNEYSQVLQSFGAPAETLKGTKHPENAGTFLAVKRKLKLRTRIKSFLYKLADKL
jgi:hypothetical protein